MLLSNVRIALRVLRTHRLRSALTMLGIVIGVAAVVAMNAIGSGASELIAAQIRSLGANLISINPGSALMTSVRLSNSESNSSEPPICLSGSSLRYTIPAPERRRRTGDRVGGSWRCGGGAAALRPSPVYRWSLQLGRQDSRRDHELFHRPRMGRHGRARDDAR